MFPFPKFADNKFSAEILYPNGSVAFSYSPSPASSSSSKSKENSFVQTARKNINTAVALASPVVSQKNSSARRPKRSEPRPKRRGRKKSLASVITIGEKNNLVPKYGLSYRIYGNNRRHRGIFSKKKC